MNGMTHDLFLVEHKVEVSTLILKVRLSLDSWSDFAFIWFRQRLAFAALREEHVKRRIRGEAHGSPLVVA